MDLISEYLDSPAHLLCPLSWRTGMYLRKYKMISRFGWPFDWTWVVVLFFPKCHHLDYTHRRTTWHILVSCQYGLYKDHYNSSSTSRWWGIFICCANSFRTLMKWERDSSMGTFFKCLNQEYSLIFVEENNPRFKNLLKVKALPVVRGAASSKAGEYL